MKKGKHRKAKTEKQKDVDKNQPMVIHYRGEGGVFGKVDCTQAGVEGRMAQLRRNGRVILSVVKA